MYLPTSASDAWPVCALIRQAGVPALAALVTNPARSECPEYCVASRPIALTRRLTIDAMASPESRLGSTCARRVTGRNTGPSLIPDSSTPGDRDLASLTLLVGLAPPNGDDDAGIGPLD